MESRRLRHAADVERSSSNDSCWTIISQQSCGRREKGLVVGCACLPILVGIKRCGVSVKTFGFYNFKCGGVDRVVIAHPVLCCMCQIMSEAGSSGSGNRESIIRTVRGYMEENFELH